MTPARTPPLLESSGTRLYPQAAELRSGAPATRVRLPGDLTAWSVTRGDVVKRLVTDARVSRDPRKHWPGYTEPGPPDWLVPWTPPSMFNADGGDHVRLRKLISRAFTPRRTEALRPAISEIVAGALEAIEARPRGEIIDLRAAFSRPIPLTVICDLFGVPPGQRPRMQRVIDGAAKGAPLAKLEAAVALPALFGRFPHLTLATGPGELPRVPSFIVNDYAAVPVHLHGRHR